MANLNVTYEEMSDASRRIRSTKEELTTKFTELRSFISNLVENGYVTDGSSRAFDEAFGKYIKDATEVVGGLENMGAFLDQAASALRETDEGLANSIRGNG